MSHLTALGLKRMFGSGSVTKHLFKRSAIVFLHCHDQRAELPPLSIAHISDIVLCDAQQLRNSDISICTTGLQETDLTAPPHLSKTALEKNPSIAFSLGVNQDPMSLMTQATA